MRDDGDDLDKLVRQAFTIEAEEARQAGAVRFMARALTQATMPHRRIQAPVFKRQNGSFSLAMLAHPDVGLPYGSIPRLLVSWVTTEAVRTKSPVLELGPSLSAFMAELDLTPTGGRWGSIPRLRDQMTRLFSASISCLYDDKEKTGIFNVQIVEEARLWWNPKAPNQAPLWKSTIELGKKFFEEASDTRGALPHRAGRPAISPRTGDRPPPRAGAGRAGRAVDLGSFRKDQAAGCGRRSSPAVRARPHPG